MTEQRLGTGAMIITPTYNERENLKPFLEGVFGVAPGAHVLVVDDNSPDGTGDLAEQLARDDNRIQVMRRPSKMGLGTAYLDGFAHALAGDYAFVFEMDTDLSHDPGYLPDFFARFDEGADVVIGSRNVPGGGVEGWGLGRHLLSKGGSLYSRAILGLSVRDLTSGYKGFRRNVLETIELSGVHSEGYSFQVELTYRAVRKGFAVAEVPIVFVDRRAGHSKMSRRVFAEAVMMMPKLRLDALRGKL